MTRGLTKPIVTVRMLRPEFPRIANDHRILLDPRQERLGGYRTLPHSIRVNDQYGI